MFWYQTNKQKITTWVSISGLTKFRNSQITAKRSTQGLRLKRSRVKVQLIQLWHLCYRRLHPRLCQSTTSVSTTCLLSVSLCPGSSQSPSQTSFTAMAEAAAPIPDPAPAQPEADRGDQETVVSWDTKGSAQDFLRLDAKVSTCRVWRKRRDDQILRERGEKRRERGEKKFGFAGFLSFW